MLRDLRLTTIFLSFGNRHCLKLKDTAMVTPSEPTNATFFYGVFELFFIEIFGNNLLLYIILYKNVIAVWRRYDEERGAEELWTF